MSFYIQKNTRQFGKEDGTSTMASFFTIPIHYVTIKDKNFANIFRHIPIHYYVTISKDKSRGKHLSEYLLTVFVAIEHTVYYKASVDFRVGEDQLEHSIRPPLCLACLL
jgi:hypothetical protein